MLKGIDRLLTPTVLKVLAEMGHGDEILIADANFPSASNARRTALGEPIYLNCDALRAVEAVLSLMPLDTFGDSPVVTMAVVSKPDMVPPIVQEAAPMFAEQGFTSIAIERFAFYDRARTAYAIVQTDETRLYGNFILRKGVISPDG
ncbi:RbsD/FucU family protein [Rhizobium halophytocola]|uniref:L-fucose mutarotase n=1 Tax=Rhizobium halophytocola TaxID=735519 RepID=A0ABS4E554_9HYPH|nr:RbsD/FucU domain-containing protein [Rhizobium halophytocola]MBP1853048.1 L-fucose mutarotase [Rhizobium halophytocola]